MALRVHFRGVGVYVANDTNQPGRVTQVLFPNTALTPQDGDDGTDSSGRKTYKHADGSPAKQHFAGAILKAKNGDEKPIPLENATVIRNDRLTNGAAMDSAFTTLIPPLAEIIVFFKKLKLVKSKTESALVTTQFLLGGTDRSEINSIEPNASSHNDWYIASLNGVRRPESYRLEGLWTINASEVVFDVFDLGKTNGQKRTQITLNNESPDLYVFNFDTEHPTVDALTAVREAKPGAVDHDFKWSYQLFRKSAKDWHDWLVTTDNQFPAPILTTSAKNRSNDDRLPSVSTCFQLVWTGDDES